MRKSRIIGFMLLMGLLVWAMGAIAEAGINETDLQAVLVKEIRSAGLEMDDAEISRIVADVLAEVREEYGEGYLEKIQEDPDIFIDRFEQKLDKLEAEADSNLNEVNRPGIEAGDDVALEPEDSDTNDETGVTEDTAEESEGKRYAPRERAIERLREHLERGLPVENALAAVTKERQGTEPEDDVALEAEDSDTDDETGVTEDTAEESEGKRYAPRERAIERLEEHLERDLPVENALVAVTKERRRERQQEQQEGDVKEDSVEHANSDGDENEEEITAEEAAAGEEGTGELEDEDIAESIEGPEQDADSIQSQLRNREQVQEEDREQAREETRDRNRDQGKQGIHKENDDDHENVAGAAKTKGEHKGSGGDKAAPAKNMHDDDNDDDKGAKYSDHDDDDDDDAHDDDDGRKSRSRKDRHQGSGKKGGRGGRNH